MAIPNLIVYSHLRWGFVYQRPQHLLSRLAGRWRVWFVEEPIQRDGAAGLEVRPQGPHLTVLVAHTPIAAAGFHDDQIALLQPLLEAHFERERVRDAVVWLYTPMALPLARTVAYGRLVYDCMDELAAFLEAPRQLRQREIALLKRADVVFTGGPSLYCAKRASNDNVHCVPSSVDAAHFAPESLVRGSEPDLHAESLHRLPAGPRLGFYGVIDERLDIALVARLADSHAEWQIVMVGPVVKIDPATLPQRANIHWLGMQPYALLPYLLARWDLCLMPFALNESTRFISPTKTLEYMAGGKPVVSTAIHDVKMLYGNAVTVADDAASFVAACEATLAEPASQRFAREIAMLGTVSTQSWDRAADAVHALLLAAGGATSADDDVDAAETAPPVAAVAAGS